MEWKRTTREAPFEGLRPESVTAIEGHIAKHNLRPILADALMGVQTDSEKVKKGLFGGTQITYTGIVVAPRWLVWVVSGTKIETAVLSAQLRDVVVRDYAQTSFAKLVPDSGLEVSGRVTDGSENISAFIRIDDGPAGRKFKATVIEATQNAKQ